MIYHFLVYGSCSHDYSAVAIIRSRKELKLRPLPAQFLSTYHCTMMDEMFQIAGLIVTAFTLGVMLFFSLVIAPLVFIKLPAETAGRLIRALFPWYFLVSGVLATLATMLLAPCSYVDAVLIALVAVGALVSRQILMPRINKSRDQMVAGDLIAGSRFNRGHRASVIINGAQILLLCIVIWRIGLNAIVP